METAQWMDMGLLGKDKDVSLAPTLKRARHGPHGCWRGRDRDRKILGAC